MNETRKKYISPDDKAKANIDLVFSRYESLESKVRASAEVLDYFCKRINPSDVEIDVPDETARQFEPLCLWIRKTLPSLAPEVSDQALKLLDENNVEQSIVALTTLGEEYGRRLRIRKRYRILHTFIPGASLRDLDEQTLEFLTEKNLQSVKVALGRLAGMLDYAANDLEEIEDIDDLVYKNHFDPSQIDKHRLTNLLHQLQEQLALLPEGAIRDRLLANVRDLEKEIRRPRPKWRFFLATAVVVLAIVADIKTVHPEIGTDILHTIDAVVQTVVTESQVSRHGSVSYTHLTLPTICSV